MDTQPTGACVALSLDWALNFSSLEAGKNSVGVGAAVAIYKIISTRVSSWGLIFAAADLS
jgi:uncharacterized membrane protein